MHGQSGADIDRITGVDLSLEIPSEKRKETQVRIEAGSSLTALHILMSQSLHYFLRISLPYH
jgi:hypothetical protein